jgi:hypothetical protein
LGTPLECDPPGRHGATKRDGPHASIEEDEVEREAHAEGVDAPATREQEPRAGGWAVEQREPENARPS